MRAGGERLQFVAAAPAPELEEAHLRRVILEDCRARLHESEQAQKQAGRVFFEGSWLSPAQARAAYAELKRRQRRILWELVLLLIGLAGAGLLGWLLTYALCCA